MIPMITEFVEPFLGVDGSFKSSKDKLVPIIDFIPWKNN